MVDGGRELALTLMRATGYLSRAEPSLRPNPAGPLLPVHGAQLQRPVAFDYALLPHTGAWTDADLYEAADELLVPLERARGGGGGDREPAGQALSVTGAVVSALTREAGGVSVRCFNPTRTPATARLERAGEPVTGWVVDLLGAPLEPFTGDVALRPAEIVTLRID